jgi:phosphoribosyl 1,2-cyclic phosphodiesterase
MKLKIWGCRGSIPTPGKDTVRYGGNTPCVELKLDDNNLIILDSGTGIRNLGNYLMRKGESIRAYIMITHPHWDHIQGFPFFKPIFLSQETNSQLSAQVQGRRPLSKSSLIKWIGFIFQSD